MLSRRKLATKLGVCAQSIQTWRKTYLAGGLSALTKHDRKGPEFTVLSDDYREFINQTLSNPENGIQGYKELQKMMSKKFGKDFAYSTLRMYCKHHLKAKVKVARIYTERSGVKAMLKRMKMPFLTSKKKL
jgi:transposase